MDSGAIEDIIATVESAAREVSVLNGTTAFAGNKYFASATARLLAQGRI
jgi:hypothetical protein